MTQVVTREKVMAVLSGAGLLPQVQAIVDASNDTEMQLAWADSQYFDRLAPPTQALLAAFPLPDAVLTQIFGE